MRNNNISKSKKLCMTAMGAACSLGVLFTSSANAGVIGEMEARNLTLHALVHAFPHRHVAPQRRAAKKSTVRTVAYRAGVKRGVKTGRSKSVVHSAIYHRTALGIHKAGAKKSTPVKARRAVGRKPAMHVVKAHRTIVHKRASKT